MAVHIIVGHHDGGMLDIVERFCQHPFDRIHDDFHFRCALYSCYNVHVWDYCKCWMCWTSVDLFSSLVSVIFWGLSESLQTSLARPNSCWGLTVQLPHLLIEIVHKRTSSFGFIPYWTDVFENVKDTRSIQSRRGVYKQGNLFFWFTSLLLFNLFLLDLLWIWMSGRREGHLPLQLIWW